MPKSVACVIRCNVAAFQHKERATVFAVGRLLAARDTPPPPCCLHLRRRHRSSPPVGVRALQGFQAARSVRRGIAKSARSNTEGYVSSLMTLHLV